MVERIKHILAMAIPHAAQTKIDLLDSDNAVARDRASSWLLDRAGLGPTTGPSVAVNIEMRAGVDHRPYPGARRTPRRWSGAHRPAIPAGITRPIPAQTVPMSPDRPSTCLFVSRPAQPGDTGSHLHKIAS